MTSIVHVDMGASVGSLIPLSEIKAYLHVDHAVDDFLITVMANGARLRLEQYTGLAFSRRTITAYIDIDGAAELPYGPVVSVDGVEVKDNDTFGTYDDYTVIGSCFTPTSTGLYKITYTTGLSELPDALKLAILSETAYRYANRGDANIAAIGDEAKTLAMPHRRLGILI